MFDDEEADVSFVLLDAVASCIEVLSIDDELITREAKNFPTFFFGKTS